MGKRAEQDPELPEHLRCKKSDGRDWRCKKPVAEGKGMCDKHYQMLQEAWERKRRKGKNQPLPEHLRCKRSDGRTWRCKRRVLDGNTMCEIHYVQSRLRQNRQTVPETLKFKPGRGEDKKPRQASKSEISEAMDSLKKGGKKTNKKMKKRERVEEIIQDTDQGNNKGLKKMRAELIRSFLKREFEKSSNRERNSSSDAAAGSSDGGLSEEKDKEVTRDLPYGLMAIPPPPSKMQCLDNASALALKLGINRPINLVNRHYRSKNAHSPPVGVVKALPLPKNAGKTKKDARKKCHWCRKGDHPNLIQCLDCKKRFFCSDCIKERNIDAEKVLSACPVCRGSCNCKLCSANRSKDLSSQVNLMDRFGVTKVERLRYLVHLLLPILQKINQEQSNEVEMEAKLKGQEISEISVKPAEIAAKDEFFCNKCRSSILDFHRICPNCSYKLCLSCCRDFSDGNLPRSSESVIIKYPDKSVAPDNDGMRIGTEQVTRCELAVSENPDSTSFTITEACNGGLSCPAMESGGCDSSLLELRRIFPVNWMKELELGCQNVLSGHYFQDHLYDQVPCTLCTAMSREADKNEELTGAVYRRELDKNYLLCCDGQECHDELLIHFQKHWSKGQPVIVRNVLEPALTLNWDPATLFSRFLDMPSAGCKSEMPTDCRDWYEVEIDTRECFSGSRALTCQVVRHETLKLKAKFASIFCQQLFVDHHAEVLHAFPLQEYTNCRSGLLNIAANVSEEFTNPQLGPHILITYGSAEEAVRGDLVTKLTRSSHDMVNALVFASNNPYSSEQLDDIKNMVQKGNSTNSKGKSCMIENGVAGDHSEVIDEVGLQDRILGGTLGLGSASCCSTANHENGVANIRHGNVSPSKVHGSDTDSDASVACCGTSDSPEKVTDQILRLNSGVTSNEANVKTCAALPYGAQWDVFRREDAPKLLEYIRRCCHEMSDLHGVPNQAVHPIFDRSFFLDAAHKMRLKEEFKIEPWTFKQRLGEAVFIPAGCPYQIRNFMSCVNVVTGFISPESAARSIEVTDELRLLPAGHAAREELLEVKKMTVQCISEAIQEINKLSRVK